MKVKLINYTPNPDLTVAAAARLCYSPIGAEQIMANISLQETEKLIQMLVELGHWSPVEHVSFTFAVEDVSRAMTHQLVRHRMASYSQQSQRYVKMENFCYIVPPSIQNNPEALTVFDKTMEDIRASYAILVSMVHHEDARYVLPNACETKIVVTFNCRSLFNFFDHRCCERAQWEIRRLANLMLAEVSRVAPILFAKAGPACTSRNICPEGKMSCGRIKNVE
jgi:thymidylate synthase (FAD)